MLRKCVVLLAMLSLVGCNASTVRTTVFSPTLAPTPKAVNTIQLPTVTPRPSATSTPSPTPTTSPTSRPTGTSAPTGVTIPPGLTYLVREIGSRYRLLQIGNNGQPVLLLSLDVDSIHQIFDFSPDGMGLLYSEKDKGGIWLANLKTGEHQNLTDKIPRNVTDYSAQWRPGHPQTIIFGSYRDGDDITISSGFLTELQIDSGQYRLLDDKTQFFGAAPSPDGKMIAYDDGGSEGWLYEEEKGSRRFKPEQFGLTAKGPISIGGPSWSPDGKKLAWAVAGKFGKEGEQFAVAIFDLERGTSKLLHPYEIGGIDMGPYAGVWSPDGEWLAFYVPADSDNESGIWVAKADGSEEHLLIKEEKPVVWSPDSRWLIAGTMLFEVGSWRTQPFDLLADRVVGWVDLSK